MTSEIQWTPSSTRLQATRDGDRDRAAGEERTRPRGAPARQHERGGCVERRGRRRVTARKRRPERLRDRVEGRPHAVEDLLDRVDEDDLADDDGHEEDGHPPVRDAPVLDDGDDDERDRATKEVPPSSVTSWSASVDQLVALSTPHSPTEKSASTSVVAAAHEVREDPDEEPADDREPEGERQREAGRRRGIETVADEAEEPGTGSTISVSMVLGCAVRRLLPDHRRRIARARVGDECRRRRARSEESEERHRCGRVLPTVSAGVNTRRGCGETRRPRS